MASAVSVIYNHHVAEAVVPTVSTPTVLTVSDGVALLRWPYDEHRRDELAVECRPRLLLVDAGCQPPEAVDCLEDWAWLSAPDAEIGARARALGRRAACHRPLPQLDGRGRLLHRGEWISLSPIEERLMELFVARFGRVVALDELAAAGWPRGNAPSAGAVRVRVSHLRRQVRALGLTLATVRMSGHVLQECQGIGGD